MAGCAKPLTGLSGIARGKVVWKVFGRAVNHLITSGQNQCTGSCDGGTCKFGLTNLDIEATTVTPDADGDGVTVTVYGDGQCFCG